MIETAPAGGRQPDEPNGAADCGKSGDAVEICPATGDAHDFHRWFNRSWPSREHKPEPRR